MTRLRWLVLAVAVAAAGVLLFVVPQAGDSKEAPPGRLPLAEAWPQAQRADLRGNVPDGPIFAPGVFLDARTAVGTAPTPDGDAVRLLLRTGDEIRELRRAPLSADPAFENMTAAGRTVVWTESTQGGVPYLWAVDLDSGKPPRRLTGDVGNPVFSGSQYDLVVAEDKVWWVAAVEGEDPETEVRAVPLAGGPVTVRTEPGVWSLTAWPWLTDGAGGTGTTRMLSLTASREIRVASTAAELVTCSPAWCRVMVMNGGDLVRVDAMKPDGTARRQIAGGGAGAALADVALLDRFEVLSETRPDSDLTGTEGLLVADLTSGRTVELSPQASSAAARGGVLWWSTGDQDSLVWHTLDLRTVV